MYLSLTAFTKTLPQMSFHIYMFCYFFRSVAPPRTMLTAGALTDTQLPATASSSSLIRTRCTIEHIKYESVAA